MGKRVEKLPAWLFAELERAKEIAYNRTKRDGVACAARVAYSKNGKRASIVYDVQQPDGSIKTLGDVRFVEGGGGAEYES